MRATATLATPSPPSARLRASSTRYGGEGWGEGVRKFEKNLQLPNPLILSFSPISAFTRVFDALWGRRDAACRPRISSLRSYKRKTGTGETPVHEHDPEK